MKHQARGSKSLAFFYGYQVFTPNGMRDKLGIKLGRAGPNACQLGTEVCVNAGVGNVAMYKIDDKLCRNSELDCRSAPCVPKTVQLKQDRDEILHIFIAHGG